MRAPSQVSQRPSVFEPRSAQATTTIIYLSPAVLPVGPWVQISLSGVFASSQQIGTTVLNLAEEHFGPFATNSPIRENLTERRSSGSMNGLSESRTVRTTTFCCGRSQSDKLREEN